MTAVPAVDTAVFVFTFHYRSSEVTIRLDGGETTLTPNFTIFECDESGFTVEFTLDDSEFAGSYFLNADDAGNEEFVGQIEIMIGEEFGSADLSLSRLSTGRPGR